MSQDPQLGLLLPSSVSDPKASNTYVPLYDFYHIDLFITYTLFTYNYLLDIFLSFEDIY